jgi:RimJ/RimL family protein N-acetyltransferase
MSSDAGSPGSEWEGARVRLRAYEARDAEHFAAWSRDTELQRMGSMLHFPMSMVRWEQRAKGEDAASDRPPDALNLAIETLDGALLGTIGAHDILQRMGTFTYGLSIGREHWRKGYASEAVTLFFRYYFRELRYQKVNAHVFAFNERSRRFHERFGFILKGQVRRGWYTGGAYHDIILYGMTAEEFEEKHGG